MRIGRLNDDGPLSPSSLGVCFTPLFALAGAVAPALSTIGTVAGLIGTGITAIGTLAAGDQAKASAQSQALQMQQQATQERAGAQRTMFEHQRQTKLVQSQLQARAAASGAGATDDTVLGLEGGIAARGEEQALMDLANGENKGRGLEDQAKAKIASGDAAAQGAKYSALGTIASGIGTGFSRFATSSPFALPSAQTPAYNPSAYSGVSAG